MKTFVRRFALAIILAIALAAIAANAADYVIPDYDGPGFSITITPPDENTGTPQTDAPNGLQIHINQPEPEKNQPQSTHWRNSKRHEKTKRNRDDSHRQPPSRHFGKKTGAYQSGPYEISGVKIVDINNGRVMPIDTVDLKPTLDRIKDGIRNPHRNDGAIFRNFSNHLPRKSRNYYREYVVPTEGVRGPGPQRLIIGEEGEIYYTFDHYESFIKVEKE